MRNGFLGSLGALLAGAGLAFAQLPYGYNPPMQPYAPAYDYSGYGYNYGYGYGYGYGYPQTYPYGYGPNYAAGYAPTAGPQTGAAAAPNPAIAQTSGTVPETSVSVPDSAPTPEPIRVQPTETPPSAGQPSATAEPPTTPPAGTPAPASPAPETAQPNPAAPAAPVGSGPPLPHQPSSDGSVAPHEAFGPACGPGGCAQGDSLLGGQPPRTWCTCEYLLWHVKDAPLPVALVTQGDLVQAAGLPVGALNTPGTSVVNPSAFPFNSASGVRLTMGGWINSSQTMGMECSCFALKRETSSFTANSPQGGTQVFAVPYYDLATNMENALQISDPIFNPASVSIQNRLFLWGATGDAVFHLFGNRWFSVGALGGCRWLNLNESLDYNVNITSSPAAIVPNAFSNFADRFGTRNDFLGGQLGGRVEFRWSRLFLNATGKVALGEMYEAVTVSGANTNNVAVPGSTITVPTGLFAQSTNIGRQAQNNFAVVPEVYCQFGVEVFRWLRVFGGYNFLYVSNVVRPGNQIDRQFNSLNFAPGLVTNFPPALSGVADPIFQPYHPAILLKTSDFWAQGVNVGFELRY